MGLNAFDGDFVLFFCVKGEGLGFDVGLGLGLLDKGLGPRVKW